MESFCCPSTPFILNTNHEQQLNGLALMKKIKQSDAFTIFENTIHRALNLTTMNSQLHDFTLPNQQANKTKLSELLKDVENLDLRDLSRTAIVIAIAAFDSYFTSVFLEKFEPYLKQSQKIPKRMIEFLEKAGLTTEVCLELFKNRYKYRMLRDLLDKSFSRYTIQDFRIVDDLMSAYGFKDFSLNVERSMKKKGTRECIIKLIQRRHCIVHEGDIGKNNKPKQISISQTILEIQTAYEFIAHAELIIFNKTKSR